MTNLTTTPESYQRAIEAAYPSLKIVTARLYPHHVSQFNDVLVVNEALIFRFPRLASNAKLIKKEVAVLKVLGSHLSLPVPNPIYSQFDKEPVFMGYPMLPGNPLRQSILDSLDDEVRQAFARQLAQFTSELHSVPPETPGLLLSFAHNVSYWQRMYRAFRDELFPYMRLDACQQVILTFETFLNEPLRFNPVVCHGDLGPGNILYDPDQLSISGIIDFGSSALGDPAFDIASIWSCGEALMKHFRRYYPNIEALEKRALFYKSTFALQQALWAIRSGDKAAFNDGISQYI